jgi:hypothetical protein
MSGFLVRSFRPRDIDRAPACKARTRKSDIARLADMVGVLARGARINCWVYIALAARVFKRLGREIRAPNSSLTRVNGGRFL